MSRELYGILIGAITLIILFAWMPLFILGVALLSFLIGKELSEKLELPDFSYPAFFSPIIFSLSQALGGLYVFLVSFMYAYRRGELESFFRAVFVLLYTGFLASFLVLIKGSGTYNLVALVFGVWVSDILAYYIGKRFGTTPLFPDISPRKTVEGFVSGTIGGALTVSLFFWEEALTFFLIGVFTVCFGVAGDYLKSFIKRYLGIKDFSKALGEHGGFTDRFDSLLFSAPIFYWFLTTVDKI
ncbi:MAG TPA: phosphatidate cytidylyltransferase [Aquificaceae bacterium]|nr:phosphatidate cytidylyltransferase [Aquificaceae bacterium]HIQ31280.1 phosphatidate cytidylyltransferase [Aquifex aeolicus]